MKKILLIEKTSMYLRYVKFGYAIKMFLNIFYHYQHDNHIDKPTTFFSNGSHLSWLCNTTYRYILLTFVGNVLKYFGQHCDMHFLKLKILLIYRVNAIDCFILSCLGCILAWCAPCYLCNLSDKLGDSCCLPLVIPCGFYSLIPLRTKIRTENNIDVSLITTYIQ